MNLRLNEVFENGIDGLGIFYYLQTLDIPWKALNINTTLDLAYHGNHGDRIITPLVKKLLDTTNVLSTANKQRLANVIFNLFKDKWTHEYALLLAEYDPISNYDMLEQETPAEITHTITPAETTTTNTPAETTETITPAETTETVTPAETTETVTPAETTETVTPTETTQTVTPAETTTNTKPAKTVTENSVSAFNSANYVSDNKTVIEGDINDKGSESITVNHAGTNKLEVDTAGSNKLEVDTAGSNKIEVDTAGTNKIAVDNAGTNKLEVDTAGNTKVEVDTAGSDVITVQHGRTLTRKGNIGVTTTQQMMSSEIELWQWNFYESVFKDIDSVLTLYIY